MAKLLVQEFPESQSRALPTYSFIEFSTGEGIVTYYGFKESTTYGLASNSSLHSFQVETSGAATVTAKFDTGTFNRPILLTGTFVLSVPRAWQRSGAETTVWTSCDLIKIDSASNETVLLALSGAQVSNTVTGVQSHYGTLKGSFSQDYKLKIGDKLRLHISGGASGGSVAMNAIGHDPTGTYGIHFNSTDTPNVNTQLLALLPVRADITA